MDTSHINGETDLRPSSAIIHGSHIAGLFGERSFEKYLISNIQRGNAPLRVRQMSAFASILAGSIKDFQQSVDRSIVKGTLNDVFGKQTQLADDCLIMRECKLEKTVSFIVGVAVSANADSSDQSTKLLENSKFVSIKTSKGRLALVTNSFYLIWLMMTCASTLLLMNTAAHNFVQQWSSFINFVRPL